MRVFTNSFSSSTISARIAPKLRPLLSTLVSCMAVRPPDSQRHSGYEGNTGNYADKLQRALVRETANRPADRDGSTGDSALGKAERAVYGGQRGLIDLI